MGEGNIKCLIYINNQHNVLRWLIWYVESTTRFKIHKILTEKRVNIYSITKQNFLVYIKQTFLKIYYIILKKYEIILFYKKKFTILFYKNKMFHSLKVIIYYLQMILIQKLVSESGFWFTSVNFNYTNNFFLRKKQRIQFLHNVFHIYLKFWFLENSETQNLWKGPFSKTQNFSVTFFWN